MGLRAPSLTDFPPALPDVAITRRERGPHEGWTNVGDPGAPGFLGSWRAARDRASFTKFHHGFVSLRGELATSGAAGSDVFFYLPVGYRPPREHRFLAWLARPAEDQFKGYVAGDGAVYIPNVSGLTVSWLSVDNCIFAVR